MDFRPLKPVEYEAGLKLIRDKAPWCELPNPETLIGAFKGDKLEAVVGLRPVWWVEPAAGENLRDLRDLIIWLDGKLSTTNEYIFFSKSDGKLGDFAQKQWPEAIEGFEGKLFVRRRK